MWALLVLLGFMLLIVADANPLFGVAGFLFILAGLITVIAGAVRH